MTWSTSVGNAPDAREKHAKGPTRVDVHETVWLFSDDLEALCRILEPLGDVEISTGREQLDRCEQVVEKLPVQLLCLSVPEVGTSVTIFPRRVEIRWSHQWNPSVFEANVIDQIREFIASRRHPLFLLSRLRWQLWTALFAFASLVPTFVSSLRLGRPTDTAIIIGVPGVTVGALAAVVVPVGALIPSRSQLPLWTPTRDDFFRQLRTGVRYFTLASGVFLLGVLAASEGPIGGRPLLLISTAMTVVGAALYVFGPSPSRTD